MAKTRDGQPAAGDATPDVAPDRPTPQPNDEQPGEFDSKKPVYKTRFGRIIGCVWANHGENGVFFSTTIYRIYKPEGSDTWMSASSFGRDDLPLVAKIANMLHTWIFAAQQGPDVPF